MNKNAGRLLRLPSAIHLALRPDASAGCLPALPEATWQQCRKLLGQLRRAQALNWQLAAARIQRDLHSRLLELRQELQIVETRLAQRPEPVPTSIRVIYVDLAALEEEFGEVEHDHGAKTISVTTEPIELEEIYLGPFRIQLNWSDLTDHPHNYQVIAVDPHLAIRARPLPLLGRWPHVGRDPAGAHRRRRAKPGRIRQHAFTQSEAQTGSCTSNRQFTKPVSQPA